MAFLNKFFQNKQGLPSKKISPNLDFLNIGRVSERYDLDVVGLNYLNLSFDIQYKNFRVELNNQEIFTLKDGNILYEPRIFVLSDGSILKLNVANEGSKPIRNVFFNGKKLNEAPQNTILLTSQGLFFYGLLQAFLGFVAISEPAGDLPFGFGYGMHSVVAGLGYAILSFFVFRKYFWAAFFSAFLYVAEIIYSQFFISQYFLKDRIWVTLIRLTFVGFIIKCAVAIKRAKENDYFHKLAEQHEYEEIKSRQELLFGEWHSVPIEEFSETKETTASLVFTTDGRLINCYPTEDNEMHIGIMPYSVEGDELIIKNSTNEIMQKFAIVFESESRLCLWENEENCLTFKRVESPKLYVSAFFTEGAASQNYIYPTIELPETYLKKKAEREKERERQHQERLNDPEVKKQIRRAAIYKNYRLCVGVFPCVAALVAISYGAITKEFYEPFDFAGMVWLSLPVSILVITLYSFIVVWLLKGSPDRDAEVKATTVMSIFSFPFIICFMFQIINGRFDTSQAQVRNVAIVGKEQHDNEYYVSIESWRKNKRPEEVEVLKEDFSLIKPNKTRMNIYTKKGKLGFEWREKYQLV